MQVHDPKRDHDAELDFLLRHDGIRALYQPIVDIASRDVVAYEALARGPAGSALEMPDALFAAAGRAGRTHELDCQCQRAALRGAERAGLGRRIRLFVNVEPGVLTEVRADGVAAEFDRAVETLSVVIEVSERDVLRRPKELLDAATRAAPRAAASRSTTSASTRRA